MAAINGIFRKKSAIQTTMSEVYEDIEHLPEGLDELIDITDKFSEIITEINN